MASQSEPDIATLPGSVDSIGSNMHSQKGPQIVAGQDCQKTAPYRIEARSERVRTKFRPRSIPGCIRTRSDQVSRVAALAMKIRPKRSPM
jgi:hypothetical protein